MYALQLCTFANRFELERGKQKVRTGAG
jgi:hypothetical protein